MRERDAFTPRFEAAKFRSMHGDDDAVRLNELIKVDTVLRGQLSCKSPSPRAVYVSSSALTAASTSLKRSSRRAVIGVLPSLSLWPISQALATSAPSTAVILSS